MEIIAFYNGSPLVEFNAPEDTTAENLNRYNRYINKFKVGRKLCCIYSCGKGWPRIIIHFKSKFGGFIDPFENIMKSIVL